MQLTKYPTIDFFTSINSTAHHYTNITLLLDQTITYNFNMFNIFNQLYQLFGGTLTNFHLTICTISVIQPLQRQAIAFRTHG